MIRDHFRVLLMDLAAGRGRVERHDGRERFAGGSGLAAWLFGRYGHPGRPWNDPDQPLIFAVGPLTGAFPLMSKTVCAFKSPYHDQYAESHAGGRSALALRLADLDALVIVGRAPQLSCLAVGGHHLELLDVHYLAGWPVDAAGKVLRRMLGGAGHRSILRIGPAGEWGAAMAGITVDTYRHFGRLGAGTVMGAKNLKAIAIEGDTAVPLPPGKDYPRLYERVHQLLTRTDMMTKYHDLGTAANLEALNALQALPWRNLQQTADPAIAGVAGARFAADTLLRNAACAGCPVGCIHVGFVREKFMEPNQFYYRQVAYDYEPIFAAGSMLGVTAAPDVLKIMDAAEKMGLDVMSAGGALAWATEALEKGLIDCGRTIEPLAFGQAEAYRRAMEHLGRGRNDFYRLLGQGAGKAAARYGGGEFACVLGQEMAGYATGEVFFASQALGLRHSHLDSGGYSFDQKRASWSVPEAVDFLTADERSRVLLTSMVACLFAREVYTPELLAECLTVLGAANLAGRLPAASEDIQALRWRQRLETGYDPAAVAIPRRFTEVATWKGPVDAARLAALTAAYAARIKELGRPEDGPAA